MTIAEKNKHAALLRINGFVDSPPLSLQSTEGDIPQGRELSLSWLAGTIMTGLTSVVLMGGALYVAFLGQDTFSTPSDALQLGNTNRIEAFTSTSKTQRLKPVAQTRSERETIEASIRIDDAGVSRIRKQPFDRIRATLATVATSLSADIPPYDPVALLNRTQSQSAALTADLISTDIYGADVEGEIVVRNTDLQLDIIPTNFVTDQNAAEFARLTMERSYSPFEISALGYAAENDSIIELGEDASNTIVGEAENVTIMPKTTLPGDQVLGRSERILTFRTDTLLADALRQNGFTPAMISAVVGALDNVYPSPTLPAGSHLRILFGPNRTKDSLIPYRTSIYIREAHAATVALTDNGRYVLGLAPPDIEFPDEDFEEINVNNLPTIYRAIWETGRKYDLDDATIERIISLYAYDLDLDKRISAGDSIELLQTAPDVTGKQELLYVSLTLGGTAREFFRFQATDGEVDFFDPKGETGKRFLIRRPLEGGGRLRSRFGMRVHPIFGTRKLHTGVDLAAPRNTPIYAAGDGIVKRAQWVSGYGRFTEIQHRNGYLTRYAHQNKFAEGIAPGVAVRQGQIIGYVGSTGNSTGNHVHFEVRINGNPVDPLGVQLPRSKSLPARDQITFANTVTQIRELMARDASPVVIAAIDQN